MRNPGHIIHLVFKLFKLSHHPYTEPVTTVTTSHLSRRLVRLYFSLSVTHCRPPIPRSSRILSLTHTLLHTFTSDFILLLPCRGGAGLTLAHLRLRITICSALITVTVARTTLAAVQLIVLVLDGLDRRLERFLVD